MSQKRPNSFDLDMILHTIAQVCDHGIIAFENDKMIFWAEQIELILESSILSQSTSLHEFLEHIGMNNSDFSEACYASKSSGYFQFKNPVDSADLKISTRVFEYGSRNILVIKIDRNEYDLFETQKLRSKLALERLSALIGGLVESPIELDSSLSEVIREIGKSLGMDRVFIFMLHNKGQLLSRTHAWYAPDIKHSENPYQELNPDDFPFFYRVLINGEIIQLDTLDDIPSDAKKEKQLLELESVKSLLVIPVFMIDKPTGVISLGTIKESHKWTHEEVEFLESCSQLIGKALSKRKTDTSLRLAQFSFDNAPDPVILLDMEGNLVYVNDAYCELLGYPSEELLQMKIQQIDPNYTDDVWKQHWDDLIESGWVRFETYNISKSGLEIPVEVSVNYLEFGGTEYNCAFLRDITERKAAKEQLDSERFQLLSIFDGINEMIYVSDPDTYELVFANQYTLELIEHESVNGKCYKALFGFDEPCSFCTIDTLSTLGNQPFYYQYSNPIFKKDFVVHDRLIEWPDERTAKFTLAIDITQGRAAERALRASEERYRRMAETIRDGLTIVEDKRVVYVNNRLVEITGYSKEELMNMKGFDLAAPEEIEQLKQLTRTSSSVTIRPNQLDFWIVRKDGIRRFISNRYSYHEKDGHSYRYIVTTDLTERKLAEDQLMEARARAEFFNDLMAHDLNNMHQGILTALELVLMHSDTPDAIRDILESAHDQVQRSVALIANVKKFTKITDEAIQLTRLDLHHAILESIEQVRNSFPTRKITLNTSTMKSSHYVLADEFLVDLFYNLFHNSVKVAPEERVILDVSVRWSQSRDFLEVSISDHGPGISPERKETLFSRYQDSDQQGSGIGLTLVRRIVEHYGGKIRVADRVIGDYRKGASFKVLLPAA
ncbi:MAG: PAS domain S-box protein [Candidatus Lokiarchaeota archaeon]|nr:PAS domain S-box protein [Candidatus Lokiarchaeota archaeon]